MRAKILREILVSIFLLTVPTAFCRVHRDEDGDYFLYNLLDMRLDYDPLVRGRTRLEKITNNICPKCGRTEMNIYYSDQTDTRVGAWCEYCDMKAYFHGDELVAINS